MFLYKTQLSAKRRTDDLIFLGRSLIKMRNRTGPKTDSWGTPDRTGDTPYKRPECVHVIPGNDMKRSVFGHQPFPRLPWGSNLSLAPEAEASVLTLHYIRMMGVIS